MKNDSASKKTASGNKDTTKQVPSRKGEKIQNPHPLSEKDEVKEAEQRLREAQQKDGL